jgi:hypothetical protein
LRWRRPPPWSSRLIQLTGHPLRIINTRHRLIQQFRLALAISTLELFYNPPHEIPCGLEMLAGVPVPNVMIKPHRNAHDELHRRFVPLPP